MLWGSSTGERLRVWLAIAVLAAGTATMELSQPGHPGSAGPARGPEVETVSPWRTGGSLWRTGGDDPVRAGTRDDRIRAGAGADYTEASWDHDPVVADGDTYRIDDDRPAEW